MTQEDTRGIFSYKVSGFRSLQDFSIEITPGINVLLGSNGSGKTNFIDFLDFIANIVQKNTVNAISAAGGIARVFGQENLRRKIPRVTAKITAVADMEPFLKSDSSIYESKKTRFHFEYEVDIKFSKSNTLVYISHEKIKFKNLHSYDFPFDQNSVVGSIEIMRKNPELENSSTLIVGPYLYKSTVRNPMRRIYGHHRPARKMESNPSEIEVRHALIQQIGQVRADESILNRHSAFPALDAVRAALSKGQSFNLNPASARAPSDISRPPIIEPDGAGLSAVLYHMQQSKKEVHTPYAFRFIPKHALDTVISWTKMVLPSLVDISATADPHTGKYVAYMHVSTRDDRIDDGNLKIPLQNASDGTLKWLSFASLIVTRSGNYTFEEPENFLHPRMQQMFIDLIRDNVKDIDLEYSIIISTHSESIINQITPKEIILFDFNNGSTNCKRVSNSKSLIDQINKTGFGLGYYYKSNVVV